MKICSKSRKRNRRRQAAKSEERHKDAEICSLDDKDETDDKVFELLRSTYPAKLNMDRQRIHKEFVQIGEIWFKDKFNDEKLFQDSFRKIKRSKDIDPERMQQILMSLNKIYKLKTADDKDVVFEELGGVYNMWMRVRELENC